MNNTAVAFREAAEQARHLATQAAERGEQARAETWRTAADQLDQAAATETALEAPDGTP